MLIFSWMVIWSVLCVLMLQGIGVSSTTRKNWRMVCISWRFVRLIMLAISPLSRKHVCSLWIRLHLSLPRPIEHRHWMKTVVTTSLFIRQYRLMNQLCCIRLMILSIFPSIPVQVMWDLSWILIMRILLNISHVLLWSQLWIRLVTLLSRMFDLKSSILMTPRLSLFLVAKLKLRGRWLMQKLFIKHQHLTIQNQSYLAWMITKEIQPILILIQRPALLSWIKSLAIRRNQSTRSL